MSRGGTPSPQVEGEGGGTPPVRGGKWGRRGNTNPRGRGGGGNNTPWVGREERWLEERTDFSQVDKGEDLQKEIEKDASKGGGPAAGGRR